MNSKTVFIFNAFLHFMLLVFCVSAEVQIESHAAAGWNFGKLIRGSNRTNFVHYDDNWMQSFSGLMSLETKFSAQLSARIGVGVNTWYPICENPIMVTKQGYSARVEPLLLEAQVQYIMGDDPQTSWLTIIGGYFPFKYNPHIRNLGLYLFRGTTYPAYIESGFQTAEAVPIGHLLGIRTNFRLFDGFWNNDVVFTSKTQVKPLYDFSLAYVTSVKPVKSFETGGGILFDRLIPIDNRITTPGIDSLGLGSANSNYEGGGYKYFYYDTATDGSVTRINYTHRGVKLMTRFAWDIKQLFAHSLFGENDLILYGEWALIGVKNYPLFYEKRSERMPVMVGLNLPAFKLLDVLALELQYFGSPYRYDMYRIDLWVSPTPNLSDSVHTDDWKWSLYAERKISKIVKLSGQVACDHLKVSSVSRPVQWEQALEKTFFDGKKFPHLRDWYWMVQLAIMF